MYVSANNARSPYAGEQKARSPFSNIEMNMEGGSGDQDDDDEPTKADGGPIEEYQPAREK